MALSDRPFDSRKLLVLVAVCVLAVVVVVVIRSMGGGDGPSRQLTVCESAWQEAQRSAQTGAQRDIQVVVRPTLTACDTVSEWDAANIRAKSPLAEGPSVVRDLCTKFGATTPLCAEARQKAPSTSP